MKIKSNVKAGAQASDKPKSLGALLAMVGGILVRSMETTQSS